MVVGRSLEALKVARNSSTAINTIYMWWWWLKFVEGVGDCCYEFEVKVVFMILVLSRRW